MGPTGVNEGWTKQEVEDRIENNGRGCNITGWPMEQATPSG